MFLLVPRCAFPILIIYFLLAPCLFAQYSSLPPGEDHPILGSKLQKELGKALEALRANKPADARNHLNAVIGLLLVTPTQTSFLGFIPRR